MLPSSVIKEYLLVKFPTNQVFGQEFTTNSIFVPDEKMHLSINMVTGLWQDFKSHEKGNFAQLVAAVEEIPYDQAQSYLRKKMFDTPEHLFDVSTINTANQKTTSTNTIEKIFSSFKKFNPAKIDLTNLTHRLARKFIQSRKLGGFDFYIATTGRYTNRIIIPYQYDDNDSPFYFQARNLGVLGIKYLNPSREVTGKKSSEILFPFKSSCDYVFICEGPLDAISLQLNGINATCTQGARLSHSQADMLRDKQVIFAYDNDEAGSEGVLHARKTLLGKNKNDFGVAKLPKGFKDWNDLHIACEAKEQFVSTLRDGITTVDFEYDVTEALS